MQIVIESVQMNNTTKEIVTERVRLHVVTWKIDILRWKIHIERVRTNDTPKEIDN